MKAVALPAMPIDMTDHFFLTGQLTTKQVGAYHLLRCHLWQHGKLPTADAELAAICRVHPRAWEHLSPVLSPLFDHDGDGGWGDVELEAERAAIMNRRTRLVQQGAAGAKRRWEPGVIEGSNLAASPMANGMAGAIAGAMAEAMGDDAENGSSATGQNGISDHPALASGGSIDRSIVLNKQEKIDRSIDPGRAAATPASPLADAMAEAIHPCDEMQENGVADAMAGAMPNGMAEAKADAMAQGMALGMANGMAEGGDPHSQGLTNKQIIDALRAACGGNVEASVLTRPEIKPIRGLMAEGYDFVREILPIMRRVPQMKSKLRSFRGPWIRKELDEARVHAEEAAREAAEAAAAPTSGGKFFAEVDTAEWRAWSEQAKANGRAGYPRVEHDRRMGWWFASQWPPGHDPGRPLPATHAA